MPDTPDPLQIPDCHVVPYYRKCIQYVLISVVVASLVIVSGSGIVQTIGLVLLATAEALVILLFYIAFCDLEELEIEMEEERRHYMELSNSLAAMFVARDPDEPDDPDILPFASDVPGKPKPKGP